MTGSMRIGEAARAAGTTVRTIRYYEEIGLLPASEDRESGSHRLYTREDVERVREILRMKDLLGLSLEELREVVAAEEARALRREMFYAEGTPARRRAQILREGLANVRRRQELIARRRAQLDELDAELAERRAVILARMDELGVAPVAERRAGG